MIRTLLAPMLVCAILTPNPILMAQNYQEGTDSAKSVGEPARAYSEEVRQIDLSSRTPLDKDTGIQLSLLPGMFIHGWGNLYARRTSTGLLLLAAEVASIYMVAASFAMMFNATNDIPGSADDNEPEQTLLALGGVSLFFFSWIYDVATVGGAVDDYNARHSGIGISIESNKLLLTYNF